MCFVSDSCKLQNMAVTNNKRIKQNAYGYLCEMSRGHDPEDPGLSPELVLDFDSRPGRCRSSEDTYILTSSV